MDIDQHIADQLSLLLNTIPDRRYATSYWQTLHELGVVREDRMEVG
jgi:hypothetical protein